MTRTMPVWCIIGASAGLGRTLAALVLAASLASGTPMLVQAQAPRSPTPEPVEGRARVEIVSTGLEHPWALEFLPDGRLLVCERPGRLRIVDQDCRFSEPLAGVSQVLARGQGGLLDVALDPSFADNRLVYLSYAEPGEGGHGRDGGDAGTPRGRPSRGCPGDLPAAAEGARREPLRVPPRLCP